jgi:hypothetical protein
MDLTTTRMTMEALIMTMERAAPLTLLQRKASINRAKSDDLAAL